MKKVCVHFANGFEEIEAFTVVDVLRRAEIETFMVSVTGEKQVTGAHGITVMADTLFEEVDYSTVDMIVLPGGMPGAKNLGSHEGLKKQIAAFAEQNKYLAAICAAPMVYGQMGLLKDKTAVCYPGFEKELEGATIGTKAVEHVGQFITSRGVGTALAFSLKLVEILKDQESAESLAKSMLIE